MKESCVWDIDDYCSNCDHSYVNKEDVKLICELNGAEVDIDHWCECYRQ